MRNVVLLGDVREKLKEIPDGVVQTCVTSPPYWGLRDYGHEGQLGLESMPEDYVANIVEVFREVRRVLRNDGTLWLNLGDSYNNRTKVRTSSHQPALNGFTDDNWAKRAARGGCRMSIADGTLKEKDLVGIPWMVAFALRSDGWYLRSDIIWAKGNVMPESVTDRPTRSHEYIFLLTKSAKYFYDTEAVKEDATSAPHNLGNKHRTQPSEKGARDPALDPDRVWGADGKRNRRSVWHINPKPYRGAHFATFPEDLPEVCIRAGTSEKGACSKCGAPWKRVQATHQGEPDLSQRSTSHYDTKERYGVGGGNTGFDKLAQRMREGTHYKRTVGWGPTCDCPQHDPVPCIVLDPFSGSGTTLAVAKYLRRDYLGCELNPEYHKLIEERLRPAEELEAERQGFDAMLGMEQE